MKVKSESEVAQSCPTLRDPMDWGQAPLSMGFSRQEYWSGLPVPSPNNQHNNNLLVVRIQRPERKMKEYSNLLTLNVTVQRAGMP